MSKKTITPLHIEWSPNWVRVLDASSGETAEAASLSELTAFTSRNRHALVGISRSNVFLKAIRLPRAGNEDLRKILGIQIGQIFPLPADQLVYEFIQTPDNTSEGNLTLVAGMRAEELKMVRAELQRAGLAPVRILPIALAAPAVALSASSVISTSAGPGQSLAVSDALVMERTARYLTIDVVQGGILRFSRAASSKSDTATEIQRTLSAVRLESLPIVATGEIGLDGAIPSHGNALSRLNEAPPFAFEPAEERIRVVQQRQRKRLTQSLVFFMAAILVAIVTWNVREDEMSTVQASKTSWTKQITKLKSEVDAATTDALNVSSVVSTIDNAFRPAQPLSDLIAVVSDNLPKDAWLTQITVERGKPMEIRGIARGSADVSTLVTTLGKNPRFRDVKLVFANASTVGTTPVVDFNITATCVGNLPLPVPSTATTTTVRVQSGGAASTETNQ